MAHATVPPARTNRRLATSVLLKLGLVTWAKDFGSRYIEQ